jgi:hypothetical protein
MGTGYTRNDSANNIADGNVINASDLDGEFDAVQAAFNASTGHSHDGTTGEGPKIDTAGLADDAVTGAKIDSTTTITAAGFTGPLTGTASNAALLDNIDSTSFLRSDAADTKTSGDLSFSDNVKATFGAGSDLQIFSDGTHGIIKESGSGDLLIYGNNLRLGNADGSELYILGNNNAEVQLRYDNATKLATTATGTNTTGISVATDTVGSSFNQFYALGNGNVGGIRFGNTTKTNGYIYYDNGGNMNFHADGPERMRIDSSGNLLVGTTTGGGTIGTYNGFGAFAGGSIFSAATSNRSIFSRRSTDGSIIEFRKDSTGVGVIGTQNWGIGTSNPAGPLEVHKSGGDANVFITTGVTTSSTTILFGDSASDDRGRVHYDHNNDSMRLHTAGSERMRIDSSGNVGIGNSSPATTLHVSGGAMLDGVTVIGRNQTGYDSAGAEVLIDANSGTSPMIWHVGGSEVARINSNGRVGIGTTSPSSPLHVQTTSQIVGAFIGTSSDPQIYLGDAVSSDNAFIMGYDRADNRGYLTVAGDSDSVFTITNGGFVGVGTSAPSSRLTLGSGLLEVRSGGQAMFRPSNNSNDHRIRAMSTSGLDVVWGGNTSISMQRWKNGDAVVFNENSANQDFRVESDSDTHAFFVDAGASRVSMGTTGSLQSASTASNGWTWQGNYMVSCSNADTACILNRTSSVGSIAQFRYNGAGKGGIDVSTSGTTYNTTSDIRLKTDINPIADATDKLMAMNPVSHRWKADPDADAVHGFIAQEMKEIVPEAVGGEDGGEEMMSMDYGRITPVLVAALQEAISKIETLENQVSNLTTKLTALKGN